MPSTAKGFPYPASTDSNNVPADIQAVADMLELWPGIPALTQVQIDALSSGAKTPNLHVFNSTTGRVQRWNGAAWVNLIEEAADGSVSLPALVLSGTQALSSRVRNVTISTSDPSGGNDGDIWVKYV